MAAITGSTAVLAQPGRRKVGARVRQGLEASSQTFPTGALLVRLAGQFLGMGSTAQSASAGLVGIAKSSGQNQTTNGLNSVPYYAFEKDQPIKLTFSIASWIGSVHRGLTAGLYMFSGGQVVCKSGGASTCGTIIDAVDWDSGTSIGAVADGDANPVVYFVVADAAIAQ